MFRQNKELGCLAIRIGCQHCSKEFGSNYMIFLKTQIMYLIKISKLFLLST